MPTVPARSQRKAVKPAPKLRPKAGPIKKPLLGGAVPLPDVPRLGTTPGFPQPPAKQAGPPQGAGHMSNARNPKGVGAGNHAKKKKR